MSGPLDRAQALLLAGRPEEALRELAGLSIVDAFGPGAMWVRCAALTQLDRWAEAAEAARAGLAAAGPDPQLLLWLGQAEQELGNPEVAERALLDGLALAPGDVHLLCAYADLCAVEGQPEKAAELVRLAAAEAPYAAVVFATRVRVAYALGDDQEALRISREFVAEYPDNPTALALLGSSDAQVGDVRGAYANYRQAAAARPADPELAEAALDTRLWAHPLLAPLRPLSRFGPLQTWLGYLALVSVLRAMGLRSLAGVLSCCWLVLCVYSWVVPFALRRWLRRRW